MRNCRKGLMLAATTGIAAIATSPVAAQKKYDPGASDREIKVGNIMPYSGPASVYGEVGKTEAAYFRMINAEGGINGRRLNFISYDDAYSPPKTVEQARKLVESDEVLLIFSSLGTPTNTAIQRYMNTRKVPQLFISAGATKWDDPQHFPWTMRLLLSYQAEARIYAAYLLDHNARGKIGILYQNDDYGRDYVKGLKDGLHGKIPIVAERPYEATDTTIDSQIANLNASGADILFDVSLGKFAAQAIKRTAEIGWKPMHLLNSVAASVGGVLRPAGLNNAIGILSSAYTKDPSDRIWKDDAETKEWSAFMDRYYPDGDKTSSFTVFAYMAAEALVAVLKQCGDDLTRENLMKQAASLKGLKLPMLLPGITINTAKDDYAPIKQMQMERFNGGSWELFGPVMSTDLGG